MPIRYEFYNNSKKKNCHCKQGHIHDSRGEAGYCDQLTTEVNNTLIHSYDIQVKFELHTVHGKQIANHYVDFLVYDFDGKKEVREYKSKGTVTNEWKYKKTIFEYEYTDIPYNIIWHKTYKKFKAFKSKTG